MPEGTVSIGIPVYNGQEYLGEALASVANQTCPPTEVLLFDNASSDATLDIAATFLSPDQIRRADVNRGAIWNFNRAARESTGTYFAWLASDDRFAPEFVERCASALDRDPDVWACLPGIRYIDLGGATLSVQTDVPLASRDAGTRLRSLLRRERWAEVYCMFRRDALVKCSPLFLDEYGSDVLLVWWLLLRTPFSVLEEPLIEYRIYPVKTVDEVAIGANPAAERLQWRKVRMWRRLWQLAAADDIPAQTTRRARLELLLWWGHRTWIGHLYEDVRLQLGAWRHGLSSKRR